MLNFRRAPFWVCFFFALSFVNHAVSQTITSITPSSIQAGSSGFVISVAGSNFDSESKVRLHTANGILSLPTYFINTGLVMAGVTSNELVNPGTIPVDVANYDTESASSTINLTVVGSIPPPPPPPPPSGVPATLIYPTPGSTFRTTDVYFVWSAGTDVSAYDLHLSAVAPGGWDLYASEHVTSTFRTAPLLPTNGEKVYARLYSIIGGVTYYNDYTYTAELANPGGPITSPPGSNMLVTVTSPSHDQTVEGSTTIVATAAQTSLTDGGIAFWGIYDSGNLLWVDTNPDPSINVNLALSAGPHNLQVSAYDNSFTASTATIPVVSSSSGVTVSWQACMYTDQGQQYQAMRFVPGQPVTGMLQSEMFNNSNCAPAQWTDQLNDIGASSTWGGNGYLYWFIHRPNIPGVSAVWTVGNQTSGCVNYSTAPPC